jgi:hypothetical protein
MVPGRRQEQPKPGLLPVLLLGGAGVLAVAVVRSCDVTSGLSGLAGALLLLSLGAYMLSP